MFLCTFQARYDAGELITQREKVSRAVSEELTERSSQFGIILDDISIVSEIIWLYLISPSFLLMWTKLLKKQLYEKIILCDQKFNMNLLLSFQTHLTFGKEFTQAVELKQVAQQEAERAKFLVEKVCIRLISNENVSQLQSISSMIMTELYLCWVFLFLGKCVSSVIQFSGSVEAAGSVYLPLVKVNLCLDDRFSGIGDL